MAINLSAESFLKDWAAGDGPKAAAAKLVLMQIEDYKAAIERLERDKARFGCPNISKVFSDQGGITVMHEVVRAMPTPDGLVVQIAPMKTVPPF